MALIGPNLGRTMQNFAKAIEGGTVDTVKKSADVAKTEQLKRMRADSGGDLKLSGVGKAKGRAGNAKVGVSYKVKKSAGIGMCATALVKATGPLQIINNDTAGRVIRSAYSHTTTASRRRGSLRGFVGPLAAGQTTGGRRAVLRMPDGSFRRSVRHPGTKGKDTWQKGRKDAEPKIRKSMSTRTTAVISKGMRV